MPEEQSVSVIRIVYFAGYWSARVLSFISPQLFLSSCLFAIRFSSCPLLVSLRHIFPVPPVAVGVLSFSVR